uniref:Uncharacterized protein n=1 Tax=Knipowitschia caucasica TaxID=637954 RepID=A0AAV2MH27_KNICA
MCSVYGLTPAFGHAPFNMPRPLMTIKGNRRRFRQTGGFLRLCTDFRSLTLSSASVSTVLWLSDFSAVDVGREQDEEVRGQRGRAEVSLSLGKEAFSHGTPPLGRLLWDASSGTPPLGRLLWDSSSGTPPLYDRALLPLVADCGIALLFCWGKSAAALGVAPDPCGPCCGPWCGPCGPWCSAASLKSAALVMVPPSLELKTCDDITLLEAEPRRHRWAPDRPRGTNRPFWNQSTLRVRLHPEIRFLQLTHNVLR